MVKVWDEQLMWSKYHLSTSKRLFENFNNYDTKRFLSGTIHELAESATGYVNSFLIYLNFKKKLKISKDPKKRLIQFENDHEKEFNKKSTKEIIKIFQIRSAQKNSPVEILKKDKILLLDNGEYRAITIERLKELLDSLEDSIKKFENNVKN